MNQDTAETSTGRIKLVGVGIDAPQRCAKELGGGKADDGDLICDAKLVDLSNSPFLKSHVGQHEPAG